MRHNNLFSIFRAMKENLSVLMLLSYKLTTKARAERNFFPFISRSWTEQNRTYITFWKPLILSSITVEHCFHVNNNFIGSIVSSVFWTLNHFRFRQYHYHNLHKILRFMMCTMLQVEILVERCAVKAFSN